MNKNFTFNISQLDYDETMTNCVVCLSDYWIQENAVKLAISNCPGFSLESILVKATIINQFYSTGIIDIFSVAKQIYQLAQSKNLEQDIHDGKEDVIKSIETVSHRGIAIQHTSFATKYVSFENPKAFPIYDNLVASAFCILRKKGFFVENACFTKEQLRCNYSFYKKVYDEFIKRSGLSFVHISNGDVLSYKEIDSYLWSSRKIHEASLGKNAKKVNMVYPYFNNVLSNSINNACK